MPAAAPSRLTPLPFEAWRGAVLPLIDAQLEARLRRDTESDTPLGEAMRYAVMNGGKRVRALLVLASSAAFAAPPHELRACTAQQLTALDVAAALEFLHAYSLVHDDLPALDNDDWRRGQATVHKRYDEATAILVGDALQSLALWLMARTLNAEGVAVLSKAALLMCQGQMRDFAATGSQLDVAALEVLQQQKTGALISAAITLGAQCAQPSLSPSHFTALAAYAEALGLAFQIRDDILDATATQATLGKTVGKDQAQGKPTFVTMLGLAAAQTRLTQLGQETKAALSTFTHVANPQAHAIAHDLAGLARFVMARAS